MIAIDPLGPAFMFIGDGESSGEEAITIFPSEGTFPMAADWSRCRVSCISFALCLAEIAIVWGALAFSYLPGRHDTVLIVHVITRAWLIGGLCSLGFGVVGLLVDRDRMIALAALGATVVTFFVGAVPMIV